MKLRHGFTLVEIMVVLAVMAALSLPLAQLSRTLFREMPRSGKAIEAQASLSNCLNQIRRDINIAKSFPEFRLHNEHLNKPNMLLLQYEEGFLLTYYQEGEKIIRRLINSDMSFTENQWDVWRGQLEFDVLRKEGDGYAVAVKSYIADRRSGRTEKKMQNSHLYFVNAYTEKADEKTN